MTDDFELPRIIDHPSMRRLWLLWKGLECAPLDRAMEYARAADAFITTGTAELSRADASAAAENAADGNKIAPALPPRSRPISHEEAPKRTGLALSPEKREQLLDQLAAGATNSEVAREFGSTSRQVQGIRLGAAREIAKRRDRQAKKDADPDDAGEPPASAEEIVRYLRQQDDVVVPQDDGQFLVNGRFRLGFSELISRANRMRHRQGKPEFTVVNGHGPRAASSGVGRHPIFWEEPRPNAAGH